MIERKPKKKKLLDFMIDQLFKKTPYSNLKYQYQEKNLDERAAYNSAR